MGSRPEISGEVKQEVAGLTAEDFNVPSHRVSFEDRVRVLLDKYREARDENEELRERVDELEQMVNELRVNQAAEAAQQGRR